MLIRNKKEVVDGTSNEFRWSDGVSVSVFYFWNRNIKPKCCPHCNGVLELPRNKLPKPYEVILHYRDELGKWQNIVLRRKEMPTEGELRDLWLEYKKNEWTRI